MRVARDVASTTPGRRERVGRRASYVHAIAAVLVVTALLAPFPHRISPTTVGFAFLLAVLFVAASGGMGPAVVASVLGILAFNFFFLPPFYTFTIRDPENWVALAAFLVTAITAGQLSAWARDRAEEAETSRAEIARLYAELTEAFDRASRAEALRQAERMRTALLDAVTHDLRTPLTSIKVSVSTLLDEAKTSVGDEEHVVLDDEGRIEMLEIIDEEADRLNRFIGNLVELARIEAGQMQLRRGWTPSDMVVSNALARASGRVPSHTIKFDVAPDAPSVHADGRALADALYTLVDNAAKYAPQGTHIRIVVRSAEPDGVEFAVEDEGPGIPEALRERVFEKFFRIRGESGANAPPGTGMGLAIARGIVEAHGGRIWAEEGPAGRGARIAFVVPVGDDEQEAVHTRGAPPSEEIL